MKNLKYMLINLPNPPGKNVYREYAGGYGTVGTLTSETILPTYLMYGASAAKRAGCLFEILDAQGMKYESHQVVDSVERYKPDILITWISLPTLYDDLAIVQSIKKAVPDILVISLGAMSNMLPEEVLGDSVDLAVKGRYLHYNLILNIIHKFEESKNIIETFEHIGGAVYLEDGKVTHSSIDPPDEELDDLSFDIYNMLPVHAYIGDFFDIEGNNIRCIPLVTGTGCPFGCMYCPYPFTYGKKVNHKSIDKILAEMEFLKANFDINGFDLRDQVFTLNKERVIKLCDEIIKRKLDVKWLIETRVDQVDHELLSKMKDAGCFRIHYGVETGTPEMLIEVGKPGVDIKKIKDAFKMTKDLGIYTMAHVILGLPGENKETLDNTIALLYDLEPNLVNLNIATPYPGTKLFKLASEKNWIKTYNWPEYTSYNAIMRTEDLDVDDLIKARKKIRSKFRTHQLLNDSSFRKHYLKRLPQKLYYRFIKR
ncbi:radical SAM protein [Methanococcoides sp. NM1]|uniref:B12-binding domain-containing radical SAM protein n=1 Tax=Methanococcoides sp. NM1 TaxID=1201013 RepID=UPI0014382684|nr:radical SAM protein [Methanococcoides sp. NM1]